MRNILPIVNGVDKAIAQGQATIKTAVNTLIAVNGLINNHIKAPITATLIMVTVNKS